jgi:hypothetical protein
MRKVGTIGNRLFKRGYILNFPGNRPCGALHKRLTSASETAKGKKAQQTME